MATPTPEVSSPAPSVSEERLPLVPLLGVRALGLGMALALTLVLVGIYELIARYTIVELEIAYVVFLFVAGFAPNVSLYLMAMRRESHLPVPEELRPKSSSDTTAIESILGTSVAATTVTFVTVTSLLIRHSIVSTAPALHHGKVVVLETLLVYAWSVVNAIPLLNLTEAFAWKAPYVFNDEGGRLMVLAFKLLLIVPLFQLSSRALRRRLWREDEARAQAQEQDAQTPSAPRP
jgi:hypothetical protein